MTNAITWGVDPDVDEDSDAGTSPRIDPPSFNKPTRPALETLSRDQRELLRSWLAGFADRAGLLRWCHEATIATLGQLPPEWHRDRLMSLSELTTLVVVDAERERWLDQDALLDAERAREWRLAVASSDLIPACQTALRRIRWSAVEYTSDHDDDNPAYVDVADQDEPAMRPGLGETATRQRWVIERGLAGFDSRDEIVESWIPVAIHASFGELDESLASAFWSERPLRAMFVDRDDPAAQFYRESFLALEFLPAFNAAVEQLADRAGEAVSGGEKTDHSPAKYPTR
ncbi:hypothetical protein [Halobellus captivus]|uniref:hypothetical protein n=1 Tax=Halobellus captivus TaxID=2592614 RepID=UPI00119D37B9|nr:hypothetical protein [Halobellus captivus]